ncbi:hypothetical protein GJ496_002086 [Pomphorhynchus laevis]|nr:hypothetical protein GJ496_002086 [Pomphorhynchus laevis]
MRFTIFLLGLLAISVFAEEVIFNSIRNSENQNEDQQKILPISDNNDETSLVREKRFLFRKKKDPNRPRKISKTKMALGGAAVAAGATYLYNTAKKPSRKRLQAKQRGYY